MNDLFSYSEDDELIPFCCDLCFNSCKKVDAKLGTIHQILIEATVFQAIPEFFVFKRGHNLPKEPFLNFLNGRPFCFIACIDGSDCLKRVKD